MKIGFTPGKSIRPVTHTTTTTLTKCAAIVDNHGASLAHSKQSIARDGAMSNEGLGGLFKAGLVAPKGLEKRVFSFKIDLISKLPIHVKPIAAMPTIVARQRNERLLLRLHKV
jgi:hypothetical protein